MLDVFCHSGMLRRIAVDFTRVPPNSKRSSRNGRKIIPYALYTNSSHRVSRSPYGSPPPVSVLIHAEVVNEQIPKNAQAFCVAPVDRSPDRSARRRHRHGSISFSRSAGSSRRTQVGRARTSRMGSLPCRETSQGSRIRKSQEKRTRGILGLAPRPPRLIPSALPTSQQAP